MSRRSKGVRLWLRPERQNAAGKVIASATWLLLDKRKQVATGCDASDTAGAERFLADYMAHKYQPPTGRRDPSHVPINDVIALYARDVAAHVADPKTAGRCLSRVLDFFGKMTLADVNGVQCRAYAKHQTDTMARKDLEYLRAAINHHRREGLHDRVVSVWMPPTRPPRERWLTRHEAAALLWKAWRGPESKHIARFILASLFTGRRAGVVMGASFHKESGRTWIDTDRGMMWPPERAKVTKKRNPPAPLSPALLIHLRAWKRHQRYVIEFRGRPVKNVAITFRKLVREAGIEGASIHTLRHTAVSWMIQSGADALTVGRFVGMSVQTLERVYSHFAPEHLASARDALTRMTRSNN
jgi:integrase